MAWVAAAAVVAAVLAAVLLIGGFLQRDGATPERQPSPFARGFVVLAFDNLTDDPVLDQVALGIGDAVVGTTSQVASSSFRRVAVKTPPEEGEDLCSIAAREEVDFVIRGTLRRVAETISVAPELLYCPSGDLLWRELYERDALELASLESAVGDAIRNATDQIINQARYYTNPDSYPWLLGRRTRSDNAKALEMVSEEIAAARRSGDEVAEIGWLGARWEVNLQRLLEGWAEDPLAAVAQADADVRRRCEIDPSGETCVGGIAMLGRIGGRGYDETIPTFGRMLELWDGAASVHGWMADDLANAGRTEEALFHVAEALRLSPEDPYVQHWLNARSRAYMAAGDFEAARDTAQESVARGANDPFNMLAGGYQYLAVSLAHLGDIEGAEKALERVMDLRPDLTLGWVDVILASAPERTREIHRQGLLLAGLEPEGPAAPDEAETSP